MPHIYAHRPGHVTARPPGSVPVRPVCHLQGVKLRCNHGRLDKTPPNAAALDSEHSYLAGIEQTSAADMRDTLAQV